MEVGEVISDDLDEMLEVVASVLDKVATGFTEPLQPVVLSFAPIVLRRSAHILDTICIIRLSPD